MGLICRDCNKDLPEEKFHLRRDTGRRRPECYTCEGVAAKMRRCGNPDVRETDRWWRQRRAWPWPPGTKIFEDVQFKVTA